MRIIACSLISVCLALFSCKDGPRETSVMFDKGEEPQNTYDLDEIINAGELIAVTLSGPETYYEYRGKGFGTEYELLLAFTQSVGVKLRMELAHDTTELKSLLSLGEADIIALNIQSDEGQRRTNTGWLVSKSSPLLAEEINAWYSEGIRESIKAKNEQNANRQFTVRRNPRPAVLNSATGQISQWDNIIQKHASAIGWDWRLIAAICYQESAFDPEAVSWVGAQGLMQLMPETASQLGVPSNKVFDPEQNVSAGCRYLKQLSNKFTDITDIQERIPFVLASYNGGVGHIRDAMALAKKNGKNHMLWKDVSPYVLALQQPRFYSDAVVQHGYLRGSETANYVTSILNHWDSYRGVARSHSTGSIPAPSSRRTNSTPSPITRPDIDIH